LEISFEKIASMLSEKSGEKSATSLFQVAAIKFAAFFQIVT
jgi:hypothetical protein